MTLSCGVRSSEFGIRDGVWGDGGGPARVSHLHSALRAQHSALLYTSLTTIRVPSTAITWTRVPAGMNPPSDTTSTNLSANLTTPAGRSVVLVVPIAPSRLAASPTPASTGPPSGLSVRDGRT